MKIKSFLKLVEIQTKVASVIPFLLGLVYTLYNFGKVYALNLVVMFFAMVIFDMSVTALNNYVDYKKAIKKHGYGYEIHNSIVQNNLKESTVLITIITMMLISTVLGIYLVLLTNYVVLLLGIICFAIGIIYSYGPIPISRTPFGEMFSGLTMGFLIPFITIYINTMDKRILDLTLSEYTLSGKLYLMPILGIIVATIPAVFCIANIMLANNICDMEDDIENKRYTLPIFIGKEKSIVLLKALFYLSYVAILLGVALGVLPIYSLLAILTVLLVKKNIKLFAENTTKKDTFALIVANFLTINVPLILSIFVGVVVKMIF